MSTYIFKKSRLLILPVGFLFTFLLVNSSGWAQESGIDFTSQPDRSKELEQKNRKEYRNLSLKVRTDGTFMVPMPNGQNPRVEYSFHLKEPVWPQPAIIVSPVNPEKDSYSLLYYEKFLTTPDSYLKIGEDQLPLTCIYIKGQDNRYLKNFGSPLFPGIRLEVYLVTNSFDCMGPKNPGFPFNGKKEELWDTYIYYVIRDPTIMLPADAKLRYRWNEYAAVLVK